MSVEFLKTDKAPAAIGPYSQAGKVSNLIFVSGQLPITNGELQTEIKAATLASLTNVLEIIKAGGGCLESIVKVNVFVKDMNDFEAINGVYAEFFGDHKPARALVQVAKLPKDALIEIEAVAAV
ncbi:RidA family protein [Parvimonas micra]